MGSTLSIPILYTKLPGPDLSAEGPPGFLPVQADICPCHSQRTKDGGLHPGRSTQKTPHRRSQEGKGKKGYEG